jgi:hypothetical protein
LHARCLRAQKEMLRARRILQRHHLLAAEGFNREGQMVHRVNQPVGGGSARRAAQQMSLQLRVLVG